MLAAALGWMLDGFDVMLYALVLTYVMADLGMSKAQSGLLGTLTLVASGFGGMLFGLLADRIGRKKGLMLSILTYSICSFASGLSTSVTMLAVFRFILGLGMGGEWNTGATLVAETWPVHLRAKALAIVQGSFAIGYALAALVAWMVLRVSDWRMVFFVGVLPALVTLWIRRGVPESEMWSKRPAASSSAAFSAQGSGSIREIFSPRYLRSTLALLFLNFFGMFAWWGLFTWIPAFLVLSPEQGGLGFSEDRKTLLLVLLNLTGMLPGYVSFGWVADWIGRRNAFVLYTLAAAVLVPLYATADNFWLLLLLGSPVAFFGTGFFSGSGIIGSEIFPTHIRARALGFTYNGARTLSSVGPYVIGYVATGQTLGRAFLLCAASFLLASVAATQLPETRGKELE
ncbi:MAG: MFS transporter [Acidobacteria bacterium]|nr:MFS transporter [Acidobacteriota bacterium]